MAKRRVGRPTSAPKKGEKATISIRVTPQLKARLDRASTASDRSLSQEAELRLEQTFRDQDALLSAMELAYGQSLAGLLQVVGAVMHGTGPAAGVLAAPDAQAAQRASSMGEWIEIPWARRMVRDAADMILDGMLGRRSEEAEGPLGGEFDTRFGVDVAWHYLRALGLAETADQTPISPDLKAWAERVRPLLSRWLEPREEAPAPLAKKGRAA